LTFESADLAFTDLPNQSGTEALRKYNLIPGQYICITPGGFYSLYTRNRQSYLLTWQNFIYELISHNAIKDKKLVFLPHVTRPTDDRTIISDFKDIFPKKLNALYIEDELMPHQLRQLYGNGYLTITSRLHVAISTFQMCKPAIAIGFSTKYEGVIGRSIKCPELTIHSIEAIFEKPEIFAHEIMRAVEYVAQNYEDIVYKLTNRIPELKKMVVNQVSGIATTIFPEK
jgi:colanic acid/amylovoran biosynthesis protein